MDDTRKRRASSDYMNGKRQELLWDDEFLTTEVMTLGAKHASREILTIEINGTHPKDNADVENVISKV